MTNTQQAQTDPAAAEQQADGRGQRPTRVFSNILCAVDGTSPSMAAVRMAASLAGPDGHLTLLAVRAEGGVGDKAMAAIGPAHAEQILRSAKRIADDVGVASSVVADPDGPPVDVILRRACDHDLLAIGAPTSSWLGGMFIAAMTAAAGGTAAIGGTGGVAAAAQGRFNTPMLVVRMPFDIPLRGWEILVASDGEEGSDEIVELAGRLACSQAAQVTLVNALGAESKMNPRAVQAQAQTLKAMVPAAGDPIIEAGKASEVILDAARSTAAALVVMGSRRLTGLRALGSVSRRVVHGAPCSVLLVAPGGGAAADVSREGGV